MAVLRHPQQGQLLGRGLIALLAVGADLPQQTLAHHAPQGAGHQPRLHAHVLEPVYGGHGVVGVQSGEHQMTGDGGPHGDGGRLAVPDLTHGDDVRVLTQDGSQAAGEGHAGLFVDLALADAGDVVLHRVLQRDDVDLLTGQIPDHVAHGGGLTGACGTHQQNDAAGVSQQSVVVVKILPLQSQLGFAEGLSGLVQQTQHHLLAIHRGHGGDTQVQTVAPHRLDGVAVLRDLMLGNIHTAHDFQAGDHGILQIGRHCQDAAEQTVDTHPHHHLALLRLQMDVTGPLGIGPLDEGVDEADGGGGLLRVRRVLRHLGGDDIAAAAGLSLHLLDDPCRTLTAVQAADGLLHGLAGGDHGDDALTGGGFDLILSHEVQRIAHGQIQAVAYQLHRHHTVFLGDVPGDILGQLHGDGNGRQVHKVHAQLHTQSVDELRLRDEAVLDQCVAQPLLGLLLERQSTLQLLLCDGPGRHQQIAQAHIGHFTHLPVESPSCTDRNKTHSLRRRIRQCRILYV